MPRNTPTLHMLCGRIASGKSTLAQVLSDQPETVLISEDQWLSTLFGDEMSSISDYVRCSAKLRQIMGPHVSEVLAAGVSVVLDTPANTVENRNWMRGLFEAAEAEHMLHLLDVPDDLCLERLRARNASGTHAFTTSEQEFARISRHFVAPSPGEGFTILRHTRDTDMGTSEGRARTRD